jgi:hypothetical protein
VRPVRGLTVKQLEQLELALRASARENAGQQMLISLVSLAKEHVDAALTGADLPYVQSRQLRLFYSQALFFFVVSLMSVRSKSTRAPLTDEGYFCNATILNTQASG